jgi:hypothetical protein
MLRAAERGVLNVAPGSMAQSHWPQKSMNRQISRLCGTVGDSASVDSAAYVESATCLYLVREYRTLREIGYTKVDAG